MSRPDNSTQSPRYDFLPITAREPIAFPGGKRLAVMIYVNIEHVPFGCTAPAHAIYPGTIGFTHDTLNHGWRDYGNRVGLWRIMQAMDDTGFRGTVNLNSDVCREYPEIIAAGNARGWEWAIQGDNNMSVHSAMTEADERIFFEKHMDIIARSTGTRPRGWLGMYLSESQYSPDIVRAAGIEYVSNYTHDELPVPMRTAHGPLLTMPYTLELNDVPTILGKGASARVFGEMIRDQFEVLYEEARTLPRVMSISIHPFITGHPFRMRHFRAALEHIAGHEDIWPATGAEINDWYRATHSLS